MPNHQSQARSNAAERWLLVVTGFASSLVSLDALVVSTALPAIRVDLQALIEQPVPFRSLPVSQRAHLENGNQEDAWRRAATR